METREVSDKYGFALEWTVGLVEDFKREVFDEYFHGDFSVEQWKKVLQSGKRCVGMQRVEVRMKPKSGTSEALNKAELGRLCYLLQFTPKVFNSIFASDILASNIPSDAKAFCKQASSERASNVYATVEEIFLRHAIPMFHPQMRAKDWLKVKDEYEESCNEQVRELQERIERLNADKARHASLCDQAVYKLEEGEKSHERAEKAPKTELSKPQSAEHRLPEDDSAHPLQTSLF